MPSNMSRSTPAIAASPFLRLGFIALSDAAPLIVAQEMGFFQRHGLRTVLSREVGWATIRDKIIYHELDAAHALGAMVLSTTLGLNCPAAPCVTAFVMSTNGNAITLSTELWDLGVRDAASMRDEIVRSRRERDYVFGVDFAHSSQHLHLCDWLAGAGLNPQKDVRIIIVPPPLLFRNLAARTIDGYCVGDPWNSLAIREQMGWCPATSLDLAPGHPEKVFLVRADFAARRAAEHLALVAALAEAAALCDDPSYRPELAHLLARPEYLNVPERVVAASLAGPFDNGRGQTVPGADFIQFHRNGANDPTPAKVAWLIEGMNRHLLFPPGVTLPAELAGQAFRSDLYQQACQQARLPVAAV
jgi:ABC-type nitrate/sulfonate/bicarbonate transport system substrate-binding protein